MTLRAEFTHSILKDYLLIRDESGSSAMPDVRHRAQAGQDGGDE